MENSKIKLEIMRQGQIGSSIPAWLIVLLFLIPAVVFLPGIMGKIPYPSESALYTDLMVTHYPNALYLKTSILEFQQFPLWSTLAQSGTPFAANPLSGLFYLPGWLALIFPLPEGISIMLAAHAVFGAWGMYLFLKSEEVGSLGAVAGGLIFGLTPKLAAHYGAGHVSLIYAISWTPWLFFISNQDRQGWKTGITAAFIFLADPRWSFYAGIFWLTYGIAHRNKEGFRELLFYYLKAGMAALLIASPLILPMVEFVGLSTRPRMGLADVFTFPPSPEKILGLIIPINWGNTEWYIYPGGIVLGLFIIQLFVKQLRKKNRFWIIWTGFSVLISFGTWFIKPGWIINIPIISLLRVPARALFLMGFSFTVIASRTIEYLFDDSHDQNIIRKAAFGLLMFSAGLALAISLALKDYSISLLWGFGFLFVLGLTMLLRKPQAESNWWSWILLGLITADLLGAGIQSFYAKEKPPITRSEIVIRIAEDKGTFRLYSPSYCISQDLAAEKMFELADGVDPLQLAVYVDFMEKATGIENVGYSVTIPPFETGQPASDNQAAVPDASLLGLINVKYVISEFEIENPDLNEIFNDGMQYLYRNTLFSPRAWVEDTLENNADNLSRESSNIHQIDLSPNRINITVSGPGRLVLSEINYPGWKVKIDGEEKQIELAYGLLRSVSISEGEHQVEFSFHPLSVYAGAGIAVVGWILSIWQIYKHKK